MSCATPHVGHRMTRTIPVSPGGVVQYLVTEVPQACEPPFISITAMLGDIGVIGGSREAGTMRSIVVSSGGTASDIAEAVALACVEAIERYSAGTFRPKEMIWASWNELGAVAMPIEAIPQCSLAELVHPRCPVRRADPAAPIRWVPALLLPNGELRYVPFVMAAVAMGYATEAERLCTSISTGCAAFATYEGAVLRAILEVIERDAASILWLQQLALPRIEVDRISDALRPCWQTYERRVSDVEYAFFDATTDLGVPAVYGVRIANGDPYACRAVACAAATETDRAIAKVVRELSAVTIALSFSPSPPDNAHDCSAPMDGARYMGRPDRAHAFDFLVASRARRRLTELPHCGDISDQAALRTVIDALGRRGHDVYVVDLTTDESVRAELRVVRAIVPSLQPLSFHYRARYLGHPRLYSAPHRMGYPTRQERELNPWPQPLG